MEIQFPRQDDHIGELRVEAQRLDIGDAELGGDMDLETDFPAVEDGGHVRGDDGIDSRRLRGIQRGVRGLEVISEQGDIQGHIGPDTVLPADARHFRQVLLGEIVRRAGAHVQVPDSEIDGVGPAFDRCEETLEVPRRRHDFQFFFLYVIMCLRHYSSIVSR